MEHTGHIEIVGGPSRMDLMLAVFDTDQGIRVVTFTLNYPKLSGSFEYSAHVTEGKRLSNERFQLCGKFVFESRGVLDTKSGKIFTGEYDVRSRRGFLEF